MSKRKVETEENAEKKTKEVKPTATYRVDVKALYGAVGQRVLDPILDTRKRDGFIVAKFYDQYYDDGEEYDDVLILRDETTDEHIVTMELSDGDSDGRVNRLLAIIIKESKRIATPIADEKPKEKCPIKPCTKEELEQMNMQELFIQFAANSAQLYCNLDILKKGLGEDACAKIKWYEKPKSKVWHVGFDTENDDQGPSILFLIGAVIGDEKRMFLVFDPIFNVFSVYFDCKYQTPRGYQTSRTETNFKELIDRINLHYNERNSDK